VPKILIVDDQRNMRTTLAMMLRGSGYEVEDAADGEQGVERGSNGAFDLVITDLRMGSKDGIEVLRAIKEAQPMTEVIVMTAYGTIESAVEAMKLGAFDYIQKPFTEQELLVKVSKALERRQSRGQVSLLTSEFREKYRFENIIGRSIPIRDVLSRIVRIAPTDATVLITGESGTGKELVAGDPRQQPRRPPVRARQLRRHHRRRSSRASSSATPAAPSPAPYPRAGALRGGGWGYLLFRRDRRDAGLLPGEAAPGHPGGRGAPYWREPGHQGRRADHRRHQPGARHRHRREALPAGSLLPPQRRPLPAPSASGAPRGYPLAGPVLPRKVQQEDAAPGAHLPTRPWKR
jgi:DNA-binding response OmpR family regulator